MNDRPVRLVVADDLRRSRLTVFFRLLLAVFHLLWWTFWSYAVSFTSFAQWIVIVVRGRPAEPLQRFHVHYVRFTAQLTAWLTLAAEGFPSVLGDAGYPVVYRPFEGGHRVRPEIARAAVVSTLLR